MYYDPRLLKAINNLPKVKKSFEGKVWTVDRYIHFEGKRSFYGYEIIGYRPAKKGEYRLGISRDGKRSYAWKVKTDNVHSSPIIKMTCKAKLTFIPTFTEEPIK